MLPLSPDKMRDNTKKLAYSLIVILKKWNKFRRDQGQFLKDNGTLAHPLVSQNGNKATQK